MISNALIKAIQKAEKYPYIVRVGVFGSYARSEATAESDIDILIDYDNSSDDFLDNVDNFMYDFESAIHGKVDYVTLPVLMRSHNESLREEILRDVKWIYEVTRHSNLL